MPILQEEDDRLMVLQVVKSMLLILSSERTGTDND